MPTSHLHNWTQMRVDITTFGSTKGKGRDDTDEHLEKEYCRDCGAVQGWDRLRYWSIIELAMEAFLDGDDS